MHLTNSAKQNLTTKLLQDSYKVKKTSIRIAFTINYFYILLVHLLASK